MHLLANPLVWTTVLSFLFGGIFSSDLRRLLRAILFGGQNRFVRFRRDSALARLRQLERVHGNVYELVRYLGEQGAWLGLTVFLFLGQTYMANVPRFAKLVPSYRHVVVQDKLPPVKAEVSSKQDESDPLVLAVAAGMYCYLALAIGRLLAMFGFLRALNDFPLTKSRLSKRLQRLDHRLLRPPNTESNEDSALFPV